MAFAEADRVKIRRWLGYPAIYKQSFSALEDAISQAQSTINGGVRPDSSTEDAIKSWLSELDKIETKWMALYDQMQAYKLDEMTVDPVRGLAGLFKIGRIYVGHLSDVLDTKPLRDVFSMPTLGSSDGFRSGVG